MAQDSDCAGDEQAADIFVAPLAGASQPSLPPLEFCRGVIPSQAANSRPDLNKDGSATVAAMALAPARLERLKADEKARAQDLQRDGKWIHLWWVVGRYANVSVFEVADHDELHTILSTLPLLVANKHLSDPDAATRSRECQAALACICARNLMLSIWDRKSSLTF
jgi:muconolactone delta-isomerase